MVRSKLVSTAAHMTALLWKAVVSNHLLTSIDTVRLEGYIPESILGDLSTPTGPRRNKAQTVALVDGTNFERHNRREDIEEQYKHNPRTRIYEGIDVRSPDWYSLVSLQLARLAGCRVACSLYVSNSHDSGLIRHTDAWHGLVLQLSGEKVWMIGPGKREQHIVTRRGDLLLLPEGVLHCVATPNHSMHMVFAVINSERIHPAATLT